MHGSSGGGGGSGGGGAALGQFSCTAAGHQTGAFSCQVAPRWRLLGHEGPVHR
jgi:hypothetical protein